MEYHFKTVVVFLLIEKKKNTSIVKTTSPFSQKCQLSHPGLRTKMSWQTREYFVHIW